MLTTNGKTIILKSVKVITLLWTKTPNFTEASVRPKERKFHSKDKSEDSSQRLDLGRLTRSKLKEQG